MRYMMFVCVDAAAAQDMPSEPQPQPTAEEGSFDWLEDVQRRGQRLDGDQLLGPATARTVRIRDGQTLVADGPFAETKEIIIGYDVLDCDTFEEAVAIAARHPVAEFGTIEVRPFMFR